MSHAALLTAVHVHPGVVDSVVLPEAPVAGIEAELPLSVYVQPDAWPTTNGIPPTVNVAFRAGPLFAPYEYASVPEPEELAATESHDALLAAFHAQPVWVEMPTDPVPAADGTFAPVSFTAPPAVSTRRGRPATS